VALKVKRRRKKIHAAPHRYSEEYNAWKAAMLRNDERAAAAADVAWRKRFSPIKRTDLGARR